MNQFSTTVFLSLVAVAASCRNAQLLRTGIYSEEQRKGIVELHNHLRNYVASGGVHTQPAAQNMREMRWDDELAQLAQKWADGCVFEHDPKKTNRKGAYIGQNLALFRTSVKEKLDAPDFTNMIHGWFNEVYQFGYNGTFSYDSGHYSQMIWGQTFKVGCGYSGYYQKNLYHNYLVCNYYPAGNVRDNLPYEYGRRDCEENELFRSWRYSHLCTIDKSLINSCQFWKADDQTSNTEHDDLTTTVSDSTEVTTDLPSTTGL
uniref:Venom allergen 5 n=1 Tax=Lygus hesperus TaxID=30085 RepID=A0A146L2J1_LYGHE